ncbi:MAG: hypothetical protein PHN54_01370 [Bacilli bacterium]|nr:hypothetical protein [Bacilli bacterium]
MTKGIILSKEIIVNDNILIITIKSEKVIYTENSYETLYFLDLNLNNCCYNDYYLKIKDIEMLFEEEVLLNIINNLYSITFDHNKYIGEINNKELIYDAYIEEQFKVKDPIIKIYKEYKKTNNKLKYEAFFEVYFSTHIVSLEIIKYYIDKNSNIFDVLKVEEEIKDIFKGKAHELRVKLNKLEKQYEKLNLNDNNDKLENRIKICNCFLNKINQINKKNKAYNDILKQLEDLKKSKENIIIKLKKIKQLNNKIKYINSRFNYNDEVKKIKINIKEKTKKDIIKNYNVNINNIEEELKKYIGLLKKKISNSKRKNSNKNKIRKQIEDMCFDDLYCRIEQEVK